MISSDCWVEAYMDLNSTLTWVQNMDGSRVGPHRMYYVSEVQVGSHGARTGLETLRWEFSDMSGTEGDFASDCM